jgi:hypothetical protein
MAASFCPTCAAPVRPPLPSGMQVCVACGWKETCVLPPSTIQTPQLPIPNTSALEKVWQGFRRWPLILQLLFWLVGYTFLIPLWLAGSKTLPREAKLPLGSFTLAGLLFFAFNPSKTSHSTSAAGTSTVASSEPRSSSCTPPTAAVEQFYRQIRQIDESGSLIADVSPSSLASQVKVTVASSWHYQPYQVRLDAAKSLWQRWALIACPSNLDYAYLKIVSTSGDRVGGSGWLGGSMIDVDKN